MATGGSYYTPDARRIALDLEILHGVISKNELKKMIRRNLKSVYARN